MGVVCRMCLVFASSAVGKSALAYDIGAPGSSAAGGLRDWRPSARPLLEAWILRETTRLGPMLLRDQSELNDAARAGGPAPTSKTDYPLSWNSADPHKLPSYDNNSERDASTIPVSHAFAMAARQRYLRCSPLSFGKPLRAALREHGMEATSAIGQSPTTPVIYHAPMNVPRMPPPRSLK